GADALAAVAAPDLALPRLVARRLLLARDLLVDARGEHAHRLRAVLVLRGLVLALHDDAERLVREAHRARRLVHVLSAGAARAVRVHLDVRRVDVDLDLLHLGKDRDRGRGRVDAPLRFGLGDALDAVAAALVAQLAKHALAADRED